MFQVGPCCNHKGMELNSVFVDGFSSQIFIAHVVCILMLGFIYVSGQPVIHCFSKHHHICRLDLGEGMQIEGFQVTM